MKDGEGHISIYIELMDTSSLPTGWTVTALVNLFVFDQIRDKYYTVPAQYSFTTDYSLVRFSAVKLEWGITSFVELEVFNDSSNGYLVGDDCVFGADVFLIKQPINKVNVLWMKLYPKGNGKVAGNNISAYLCLDNLTLPSDTNIFVKFSIGVRNVVKSTIIKSTSTGKHHFDYLSPSVGRLHIYPNGNKMKDGEGHISIYIELMDTSSLPIGWTVTALVNLFVFDQIRGKYFTVPDYSAVRFSAVNLEWGITRFVELKVFNDSSNGYLVGDECVFGAEVFIIKQPINKVNVLSLSGEGANHLTRTHIWKIRSFSSLSLDFYESVKFTCGDFKWWIKLYPKGNGEGKGNSISAFLHLDECNLPSDTKVFVKFSIGVQNVVRSDIINSRAEHHFEDLSLGRGFRKLISLNKFEDLKNEILVDDVCIIQADVSIVGIVTTK
ncbi:uncharacterized protein LOC124912774 [Impatiens glandulifera]|uniref:uncharacterized protein LOC124912774 n=1 Tax=Impatiens glandulifera TaxID=253017 RepID=UPI001FB08D40|nr:uncharacterized protein LOC124912774 [Impatiens glandulifera]